MNAAETNSSRHTALAVGVAVTLLITCVAQPAGARDVTVKFLRAAVASLNERESVTVPGVYASADGLHEPGDPYLREKGYSRFTIKDPESGVMFESMYCSYESSVFQELLRVSDKQTFVFVGYKARGGPSDNDVVYVTSVKAVAGAQEEPAAPVASRTYRVTLFDGRTTNRTVIANVRLGRTYTVEDFKITVEEEPREETGVNVVR